MKTVINIMAAAFLSLAVCTGAQARSLTILHTNDTHSHLDPYADKGVSVLVGGIIERAAFIDSVRRSDGPRNVLVLDAGDISQGSSYFTFLKGRPESKCVKYMKVDALSLGNHEFDNGPDALAERIVLQRPSKVICANYDFTGGPLEDIVKPWAVFRRGGFKIGVIGLLTDITSVVSPDRRSGMRMLSTMDETNRWAAYLREKKHCDLIICLTHLGYDHEPVSDQMLASQTRGVDIIVGGHSHTCLAAPSVVDNLDGEPVTIVTDGYWGEYVGVLKVSK